MPLYFRHVVSSFFFFFLLSVFPPLFSAVADWMSTIHPHAHDDDVALVQI